MMGEIDAQARPTVVYLGPDDGTVTFLRRQKKLQVGVGIIVEACPRTLRASRI